MDISCAQTNGWDIVETFGWMAFLIIIGLLLVYAITHAPKDGKKP